MMPSCVTFRDQDIAPDYRKVPYKDWTPLKTYIHNMAAKDAIRETMDDFEEHIQDGLPIAKELYRRGVISKHSVDMCDAAQFANIPSYTHNHNSFFSSVPRSLDDTFENWYHLIKVLRLYPELNNCTDKLIQKYESNLTEMEAVKYETDPPLVSSEEAREIFDSLCDEFEALWTEVTGELAAGSTLQDLRSRMCYVFLDQRDSVEEITTFEGIFERSKTRIDLTNFMMLESLTIEPKWNDSRRKVTTFMRHRAIKLAHISLKDFVNCIYASPKYRFPDPGVPMSFTVKVNWDPETTSAFRYFWLMEVVFCSLAKHQYLYRMSTDENGFTMCYATPDWVTPSISKLSREKALPLTLNGVCYCSVLNELTLPDPSWSLTNSDHYDYMNSVISITRGGVDRVLDILDGNEERRKWETMDEENKYNSYDQIYDDFPKAIPWLPQTITMCDFFRYFESNHVWISCPFYTDMRGFKLALCVYPCGKGSGKGTHISVGVVLMRGEQDDMLNFPVTGKICIRLLNQVDDHTHIEGVYEFGKDTREEARERVLNGGDFASLGLSIDQFLSITSLEFNDKDKTQYLLNESLYFQVMASDFVHKRPRRT